MTVQVQLLCDYYAGSVFLQGIKEKDGCCAGDILRHMCYERADAGRRTVLQEDGIKMPTVLMG